MSCDSNDNELKLTKEYKYLLSYIRPLIDQLEKSRDVQLCLLWLSKLEQCACWERNYRNKILSELCKQVKANCLRPPFNVSPPDGPLQNIFCGDWKTRDWIINECSNMEASTEEIFSSSSVETLRSIKKLHNQISAPPRNAAYFCSSKNKITIPSKEIVDHTECFAVQKAYQERAQSDQMVIERYQEIIKSLVSQQIKVDVSPGKFKKLQSTYEVKVRELFNSLKRAQEENEMLKRKLESLESDTEKINELKSENENLQKKIHELETLTTTLEGKCKKSEEEKFLALSDLISKLNESERRMKENEKRFKSLEKKYEENYRNFEAEYHTKTSEKEKVHVAELSNLEGLIEEKQVEINSLKDELINQRVHFEQEISVLKQQLGNCSNYNKEDQKKKKRNKAKKLEKLQEQMTILFQSQLQQILAKKDYYIASLEMQLKMNNSEAGGSGFSSDFQNSLDEKITNLETQYRKLLEDSEQQSIKRRQIDLQKIHTLEKQLLSFGGVIEDKEIDSDQKLTPLTPTSGFEVSTNAGKAS